MLRLTATTDLSGAACIGMDPDLFTPDNPKRPDPEALAACASCPVAQTCLTWGINAGETGIYGGQSLTRGRIVKPAVHPPRPDRQKAVVAAVPPASGVCRDCGTPVEPPRWYCEPCRGERRRATWRKNSNDGQPKPRVCRHCGTTLPPRRRVCDTCRRARWAANAAKRRAAKLEPCLLCGTDVPHGRTACRGCLDGPPPSPLAALLAAEVRAFEAEHPGASRARWRVAS